MTKKVIKIDNAHFNVRRYAANVEYKNQQILSEQDQISIGLVCNPNEIPEELQGSQFLVPFTGKDGSQKLKAKFKIGVFCEWYDETQQKIGKPLNAELEAKQWEAYISYTEKPRNPANDKAPSGLWVNAIMLREKPSSPFAGYGFDGVEAAPVNPAAPVAEEPRTETAAVKDPDLPF